MSVPAPPLSTPNSIAASVSFTKGMLYLPSVTLAGVALFFTATALQKPNWQFSFVCTGIWLLSMAGWLAAQRIGRRPAQAAAYLNSCLAIGALCSAYLVAEITTTAYWRIAWRDTGFFLYEESGRTIRFDPIRGAFLTSVPSRSSCITDGVVEYVGTIRGNAQGFQAKSDYSPRRPAPGVFRYAVLGDSFSEAHYIETNWPERTAQLINSPGTKVEFLNFSLYGGGLANWWSVVTRYLVPEQYELDAVIFPVYATDLERKLRIIDNQGYKRYMAGHWHSWDPATYPHTIDEARKGLETTPGYIVSTSEFEAATRRHIWPPSVPRQAIRPVLYQKSRDLIAWLRAPKSEPGPVFERFSAEQLKLIGDMRAVFSERHIPVLVTYIPSKKQLLGLGLDRYSNFASEAKEFARLMGADYYDATETYSKLTETQIREHYLPFDHHWNQKGSDRFAQYIKPILESRTTAAVRP